MTEILTESFCERCGTRYTFESVQQRARPLGRLGTLGRGLKNFVVMDDASFDEAMAVARSEDESKATNAQLEAFHQTFNFCLTCRQYTCAECWNAVEGRCLTCAPLPVEAVLEPPVTFSAAATALLAPAPVVAEPPVLAPEPGPAIDVEPLPVMELPVAEAEEAGPDELEPDEVEVLEVLEVAAPEPEVIETAVEAEPAPEPAVAETAPEPEPQPDVEEPEPEPAVAEPEPEPAVAETLVEAEPEPEPKVAESLVEAEPEPEPEVVADVEPEPEPVHEHAHAPSAPAPSPFPGFRPGRSLDDEIAAYELRIAALASPPASPEPTIQAAAFIRREPPSAAAQAATSPTRGAAEVAAIVPADRPAGAVLPGTCHSCGLSISASARFCRRCGARQDAA
jgi:hypothetical protein